MANVKKNQILSKCGDHLKHLNKKHTTHSRTECYEHQDNLFRIERVKNRISTNHTEIVDFVVSKIQDQPHHV